MAEVDGGWFTRDQHLGPQVEWTAGERRRVDVAAAPVVGFEQRHLAPGVGKVIRCRKPGESTAYHDDVGQPSSSVGSSRGATISASVAARFAAVFGEALRADGRPSSRAAAAASMSRW